MGIQPILPIHFFGEGLFEYVEALLLVCATFFSARNRCIKLVTAYLFLNAAWFISCIGFTSPYLKTE